MSVSQTVSLEIQRSRRECTLSGVFGTSIAKVIATRHIAGIERMPRVQSRISVRVQGTVDGVWIPRGPGFQPGICRRKSMLVKRYDKLKAYPTTPSKHC
ncbi:MAG: hypothetical protein O2856_05115 [Planctomycetota bacterium]|nr:hypothetical protein [Planctomycetota bacterium]